MGDGTPDYGASRALTPRMVLDGGSETLITLGAIILQRVGELMSGEILEIVSSEPSTRAGIPPWCRLTGNSLIRMIADGDSTRFWIRKA